MFFCKNHIAFCITNADRILITPSKPFRATPTLLIMRFVTGIKRGSITFNYKLLDFKHGLRLET